MSKKNPLDGVSEIVMKRLALHADAAKKYATSRVAALEVKGNAIYVDGVIIDTETAKVYETWGYDLNFVYPEGFRNALAEVEGDVTIYVNSPGGSVWDAAAIMTDLEERAKSDTVNVVVNGLAASAATYFLLAEGIESRSISKMGMVMVHRAWTIALGNATDIRKVADLLEKTDDAYIDMLAEITGMKKKDAEAAVDAETWYTAQEAVDAGLVDGLASASDDEGNDKKGKNARRRFRALAHDLQTAL